MPITISGPESATEVRTPTVPVIYLKQNWVDEWQPDQELELVSCRIQAGGSGASELVIRRPYGRVLQPWRNAAETIEPRNLAGWWVCLVLTDASGEWDQFVGQIPAEGRDIYGGEVADEFSRPVRSGMQEWTAHGGELLLSRITVERSWWVQSADVGEGTALQEWELDWMPALNRRDARNRLVGNRSLAPSKGGPYRSTYLFGGTELWSNLQAAEYLLARYAEQDDGPQWKLTGQTQTLAETQEAIDFGSAPTLTQMLRRLIPLERGLDFMVEPDEEGFCVRVYALSERSVEICGRTFPGNDSTIELRCDQGSEKLQVQVAVTAVQRHDVIRVVGSRILMCCSLWARTDDQVEAGQERELMPCWTGTEDSGSSTGAAGATTFVSFNKIFPHIPFVLATSTEDCNIKVESIERVGFKWSNDHTAAVTISWEAGGPVIGYAAGTGASADSAEDHDKARKADIFAEVFRRYAAPATWTRRAGKICPCATPDGALYRLAQDQPIIDITGKIVADTDPPDTMPVGRAAKYQNLIRSTHRFIPLKAGQDYSQLPLPPWQSADVETDFLPPLAWVFELETERYLPANLAKIDVRALADDIGVVLHAEPPHLLARYHWDPANPTQHAPKYNYDELRVTLAFLADARPMLEYVVDGDADGSVKVIEVKDAEMWYAAPGTICGVDAAGKFKYVGGNDRTGVVLRNDVDKLAEVMAGAVARYFYDRCRAEIVLNGIYWPCADLLSQILLAIEGTGKAEPIRTPITSIEFSNSGGVPRTIIRAGFAG